MRGVASFSQKDGREVDDSGSRILVEDHWAKVSQQKGREERVAITKGGRLQSTDQELHQLRRSWLSNIVKGDATILSRSITVLKH